MTTKVGQRLSEIGKRLLGTSKSIDADRKALAFAVRYISLNPETHENAGWHRLVENELARAREKHGPQPFNSRSEAIEVIREEFEEFIVEARIGKKRDKEAIIELVQTAAMCQRAAEDIYRL